MVIDYNEIVWVCPKCGANPTYPKGTIPNDDCHCTRCPGTLVKTKYRWGDLMGMPGYEDISRKKIFEEYVYNNAQYDPELISKWHEINNRGTNTKSTSTTDNKPKCPTCGSTNIKRISTLNRATSIGVLGLLSGKIGKNFECLNCKAKW